MTLPLFPVTTVGSWPRPRNLLRAQRMLQDGRIDRTAFDKEADASIRDVVNRQLDAGVDIVSDGEQRRDNFYSFVASKLTGVRMMTLVEMLDIIEDKAAFERILQTLDVPAYSISNPTCVGPVRRAEPLAVAEARFLRTLTDRPVKIPLPGPYLLTRSMFVKEATQPHYETKEDLGDDVVRVLREEVEDLIREGVEFIQFDEPVLTEVVFTQGQTRTFMCAALAAGKDPEEELEFAVDLMTRVLDGLSGTRIGLHVCRGNWSRDESTLLEGNYTPLRLFLMRMPVKQLVLEYATKRAGDVMDFGDKELGLGVVNPRTDEIESVEDVKQSVRRALEHVSADRIFLNPDCGFGTFSNRPMNSDEIAQQKLAVMAEAARQLREELG